MSLSPAVWRYLKWYVNVDELTVMNLLWYDWVGLFGTTLVVGSYFLVQSGRLSGTGQPYQMINIAGSCCILASLAGGFNLSVALLELTWLAISVYGVMRGLRQRREVATSSASG